MSWNGVVETTECMYECFRLFSVDSYFYCNTGSTGYCCAPDSTNANCKTSTCSKSLASKDLSYAYCFKSDLCGSSDLSATTSRNTVTATNVLYSSNQICLWKLSSTSSTGLIQFSMQENSGFDVKFFTGSTINVASNET